MEVQSLSELARKSVLGLIASGELEAGQQIKEEEIARRLNISRPPVREAFKRLEAEGLVVSKPRRGVFVPEMTVKDAWEIYTLKGSLYSLALELAMDRLRPDDIAKLQAHINEMSASVALSPPDLSRYQRNHHAFHHTILEVAGNDRLTQFASNLHLQIQRFSYKTLQVREHLNTSIANHMEIMACILRGKRGEACRLMKEHVLLAVNVIEDIMGPVQYEKKDDINKPPLMQSAG